MRRRPLTVHYFQMPRLWLDYCQFLMDQGRVTHTRRTFDRALRALPITQHSRIWPLYLRFLRSHPLPETAVRGYRRFLKVGTINQYPGWLPNPASWDKDLHAINRLQEKAPIATASSPRTPPHRNHQFFVCSAFYFWRDHMCRFMCVCVGVEV